jgi:ABC-2 type transport system ATP-binding protein
MLEVREINHHFGKTQVLHDINFSIRPGEVLGLLGPNGAGKSTTMRILTGYLRPSAGRVLFDGQDIQKDMMALRRRLGYLPENVPLYPELRVREHLDWVARVKRSSAPAKQVREVAERCGLGPVMGKLVRHLSKGYVQRVGLAQALLGETRLLILDEPTVGLDPGQIREIRELIKELGRDKTILLSTHILPEVELICDRVLIINKGRIVAEDTPDNLALTTGMAGRFLLRLDALADPGRVVERYAGETCVGNVHHAGDELGRGAFVIETDPELDCRALMTRIAFEEGWSVLEFKPAGVSLEEAFVHLVRDESEEGAA